MQRVLADVHRDMARVILFEKGELESAFSRQDTPFVMIGDADGSLSEFKRGSGFGTALALSGKAAALARRLAAEIVERDVVVAASQKAFLIACAARAIRRFPLVWWLHDILDADSFSRFAILISVRASRVFCTKVIATSPEARDAYAARGGRIEICDVVEPGVDLSVFTATRRVELDGDVVLLASRIASWKGQLTVIEALGLLKERGVRPQCLVAGAPLFGEDGYLLELKERTMRLGLSDQVAFLGHREDVAALMSRATVFVHVPTAPEPFGQVVVEAMASGLPVVASRAGALGRLVPPDAGALVPPDDAEAVADALETILQAPARRARMGERARAAAQAYDIRQMRAKLLGALAAA